MIRRWFKRLEHRVRLGRVARDLMRYHEQLLAEEETWPSEYDMGPVIILDEFRAPGLRITDIDDPAAS